MAKEMTRLQQYHEGNLPDSLIEARAPQRLPRSAPPVPRSPAPVGHCLGILAALQHGLRARWVVQASMARRRGRRCLAGGFGGCPRSRGPGGWELRDALVPSVFDRAAHLRPAHCQGVRCVSAASAQTVVPELWR